MKTSLSQKLLKKRSWSHDWTISNPATRRYLEFFYLNGDRNVKILEEDVSKEATRQFKLELIERNRALGFPVHLDENPHTMTFIELLEVERRILKHEVMYCGPHQDVDYIKQLAITPVRIPHICRSSLMQYTLGLSAKWSLFSFILLFCVIFPALSGNVLFEHLTSTLQGKMAVYSLGFLLWAAGGANVESVFSDTLSAHIKSEVYPVSDTWDKVFESTSFADANLLSLIAKYRTRDDVYYMRWSDLTPAEALELCLKFENKSFRGSSKRILKKPEKATYSTSQASENIPVPYIKAKPNQEVEGLPVDSPHATQNSRSA
jgi:hypothetical protein